MNHHLEKDCEGVDSTLFSGDAINSPETFKEFEDYLVRWIGRMKEIRETIDFRKINGDCCAPDCPELIESIRCGKYHERLHRHHGLDSERCDQCKKELGSAYTCWPCADRGTCEFAWDAYNQDGDCLASK